MNRQNTASPLTREAVFIALYKKVFPAVAGHVVQKGGSLDDAKDVFHDSLIIYYEQFLSRGVIADNEAAYLMGVAKNLWSRKFNSDSKTSAIIDQDVDIPDETEQQPSASRLLNYLEKAGQKCMDLLKAFYYDNTTLEEVATQFGFSGIRSATVQKYKCLEKVRDTVKQKALQYEDFID